MLGRVDPSTDPTAVTIVVTTVVAVLGYLCGSVPVADLVARRRAGTDLRDVGDRNPGYWNAKEQLGRRAAIPVFVGDVLKGAAGAAIGLLAAGVWVTTEPSWWVGYVGGGAAMVGHAFPVTAGFRGGRSVLTFVGAVVVLAPFAAAIAIALLLAVWLGSRRFDVAARVGMVAFPFAQFAVEGRYRTAATGVLMTFIGIRFAQAARADARRRRDDPAAQVSSTPPRRR